MDSQKTIKVDDVTEVAVVELLSNVFNSIAYMDPETVRRNLELGSEGGMSEQDRSIRMELGNYLMSHFSLIFIGLIVNQDFRDTFMEAVSVEIALDDKDANFVKKIRSEMKDDKVRDTKGNFVLNFSSYNDKIYRKINGKLSDSFNIVSSFGDTVDNFVGELTDEDMTDIGFCVSNFMYLIRAFSQNALFTNYVKAVCHSVQQQLDLK